MAGNDDVELALVEQESVSGKSSDLKQGEPYIRQGVVCW